MRTVLWIYISLADETVVLPIEKIHGQQVTPKFCLKILICDPFYLLSIKQLSVSKKLYGFSISIFLYQFISISIYLNVVCLVSAMHDFLEDRILYDKCIEK